MSWKIINTLKNYGLITAAALSSLGLKSCNVLYSSSKSTRIEQVWAHQQHEERRIAEIKALELENARLRLENEFYKEATTSKDTAKTNKILRDWSKEAAQAHIYKEELKKSQQLIDDYYPGPVKSEGPYLERRARKTAENDAIVYKNLWKQQQYETAKALADGEKAKDLATKQTDRAINQTAEAIKLARIAQERADSLQQELNECQDLTLTNPSKTDTAEVIVYNDTPDTSNTNTIEEIIVTADRIKEKQVVEPSKCQESIPVNLPKKSVYGLTPERMDEALKLNDAIEEGAISEIQYIGPALSEIGDFRKKVIKEYKALKKDVTAKIDTLADIKDLLKHDLKIAKANKDTIWQQCIEENLEVVADLLKHEHKIKQEYKKDISYQKAEDFLDHWVGPQQIGWTLRKGYIYKKERDAKKNQEKNETIIQLSEAMMKYDKKK